MSTRKRLHQASSGLKAKPTRTGEMKETEARVKEAFQKRFGTLTPVDRFRKKKG